MNEKDFDGDTISIQNVPEEVEEDTYRKMSPRYVTVYKKNMETIPTINHETLNGLAYVTTWAPDDPDDLQNPKYFYTDYVELLKDVEVYKKIKIGTPICFTGKIGNVDYQSKVTTYGKLRLSKIIDKDIDDLEFTKTPYDRFNSKAAQKLSTFLCDDPEKGVEQRREVQQFCLRAVSLAGNVSFDYKTLYTDTDTETYKKICEIADNPNLTDPQKIALLTDAYAKYEKEIQDQFSKELKDELNMAGRVKLDSISSLNMPQLIISGVDETPIITRGNLLAGYSEKDLIYHSIENRSLQSIRTSGTPASGYLTRQLTFLLGGYKYVAEGEDKTNKGLMIPRYKALGRTAPNGKVYPNTPIKNPKENDLVPVRSVITKFKGNVHQVTPDLIGKKFNDFTDGAAIGYSFGTSLTEAITQGALALKHGGHERVLSADAYLSIDKPCTFREEGKWIYLKVRGKELKFPRPDNLVTLDKDKFEAGEHICCAYHTVSPINKLNSIIALVKAIGSNGLRYYEKDTVILSDCYCLKEGTIHYVEDEAGNINVEIGGETYQYNPNCMYYFPDGAHVEKFDRICSGLVNMEHVTRALGSNINDIYLVFRKQFYTLNQKDFVQTGITSLNSVQEEIIEMLFASAIKVTYDLDSDKIEEIQYQGSQQAVLNRESFFTTLSYGYANRAITKALKGNSNLSDDVMTETVIGLLMNNRLDKQ